MSGLQIADNLILPLEAVTQTFGVLAKRGSGKTYTALVMAEEMLAAGQQVVIVDPVGVTWGLRTSADGEGPGYQIVIAGGDHGDIPLEPDAGALFADLVVDERLSLVLDLSLLRKGRQRTFMTAFLEALYHRNRQAVHLIVDEADLYAPQRPIGEQARLLGAMEDIVRRGRARGLGVTMVTQRPAVLNKDVLTQIECLIALRTVGKPDIAALDAWVRAFGDDEYRQELLSTVASLPVGDAWFWSPGWLGVFERIHIRERRTFDSSATPEVGQIAITPGARADVDLASIRERIEATIERRKAADPAQLKRRIAELERQLADLPATLESVVETVEVPVISNATVKRWEIASERVREAVTALAAVKAAAASEVEAARKLAVAGGVMLKQRPEPAKRPAPQPARPAVVASPAEADGLRAGERRMVQALYRAGQALDRVELGALSGLVPSGGTFGTYLSTLKRRGLVDDGPGGLWLSDAGHGLGAGLVNGAGPFTVDEVVTLWASDLRAGERRMLDVVVSAMPGEVGRDELGSLAGIEPSGGTFGTYLSGLRRRGLVVVDGDVVAAGSALRMGSA